MLSLKMFRSSVALLALLTAAAGCAGAGQSGSEVIPPPTMRPPTDPMVPPIPHCPCDSFKYSQPIRGTVVDSVEFPAVGRTRYELVVTALLGSDPTEKNELSVSSHFGGYWDGRLGCGGQSSATIKNGDEVLAFFKRGMQDGQLCCEYIDCDDKCSAVRDPNKSYDPTYDACHKACASSTQAACTQHQSEALLHGDLMLIPWADELVVGASEDAVVSIHRDQLGALTKDRAACVAEIEDLMKVLYPILAGMPGGGVPGGGKGAGISTPAADAGEDMPTSPPCCKSGPSSGAADGGTPPPNSSAPAPSPSSPPGQNGPGVTPTPAPAPSGAPSNGTSTQTQGPPAGPEEVRVRCKK